MLILEFCNKFVDYFIECALCTKVVYLTDFFFISLKTIREFIEIEYISVLEKMVYSIRVRPTNVVLLNKFDVPFLIKINENKNTI